MKTKSQIIFATFIALILGFSHISAIAQNPTARVQVIHNSADNAAEFVDVWLDDVLLIDNFEFRSATPFIDAPAEQEFKISIKDSDSKSATDPLWSQDYTLEEGASYVLVANGIVFPDGYNPVKPFNIYVYPLGRETAADPSNTDVMIFHGSTDAPAVDVVEIGLGAGTIADDLSYGSFTNYLELPTNDYILDIMDDKGEVSVQKFAVPLESLNLQGVSLVTVASGFLSPQMNNNGASFGLWVALPSGGKMIPLPIYEPTSRVQIIHNSPDLNAEIIDVWVNDSLVLDNFQFHTATPFVDFPAEEDFTISITDRESNNPLNPIWSETYSLDENKTYVLVASGVISTQSYSPAEPFNIFVYDMGQEMSMQNGFTDLMVFHGATDAPTVDIIEQGNESVLTIDDLSYGDFSGYIELPTKDYIIDVKDQNRENTVKSFYVPLETLELNNYSIIAVASGFLNPALNNNGQEFGLWVALPQGGNLIQLPAFQPATTARVQVIHNSADLAAEVVDVWLDNVLLLDDFTFRTASPFIDAPADQEFTISIAGPGSSSPDNPIWSQNYTLQADEKYILIANGIVSPSGYDPVKPFDIYVYSMAREEATNPSNTDVLVFHGSTDAPTVDIVEVGVGAGTIVDDLMYGDYAGYLELPTDNYRLAVRDETGSTTVAEYEAPLAALGLDNYAITIVASGFLNPSNNEDGPSFGLWVALPEGGTLVELPLVTSVLESVLDKNSISVFPNPATSVVNINYTLLEDSFVNIDLYDITGTLVQTTTPGYILKSTQTNSIDISTLSSGIYFLRIAAGNMITTRKVNFLN